MRYGPPRRRQMPAVLLFALAAASPAMAQTDYYNTDRSRPTRIEDASPTELYALEVKIAPLRVDQITGQGLAEWRFLPEIAYGILPRTSLEVGLPIHALGDGSTSLRGIEFSAFHNLNVETLTLPALAFRADLDVPFGDEEGGEVVPSLTGIATRTFGGYRLHANGRYSFASETTGEEEDPDHGQWLAGLAVDRVLPLRALLLIANVYAVQPIDPAEDLRWTAGGGVRYQINPYLAVDAGMGRTLGPDPVWHVTVGSALHLAMAALTRGAR